MLLLSVCISLIKKKKITDDENPRNHITCCCCICRCSRRQNASSRSTHAYLINHPKRIDVAEIERPYVALIIPHIEYRSDVTQEHGSSVSHPPSPAPQIPLFLYFHVHSLWALWASSVYKPQRWQWPLRWPVSPAPLTHSRTAKKTNKKNADGPSSENVAKDESILTYCCWRGGFHTSQTDDRSMKNKESVKGRDVMFFLHVCENVSLCWGDDIWLEAVVEPSFLVSPEILVFQLFRWIFCFLIRLSTDDKQQL